ETDIVTLGGYPGELRNVLGIWAEEIDALHPDVTNQIVLKDARGKMSGSYSCNLLFDLIHTEGAEAVAEYGSDFYKGMPVLTVNQFGKGKAWYVASSPDAEFLVDFLQTVCEEAGVEPLLAVPEGVETTERVKDGQTYLFVLNHNNEEATIELKDRQYKEVLTDDQVSGSLVLKEKGVLILAKV